MNQSVFGNMGGGPPSGDRSLSMSVFETFSRAWADDELRRRLLFVLYVFMVYALGIHISVPIPGVTASEVTSKLQDNAFFNLINTLGGGALKRLSIFSLGLNPYITASIILQILTQANPKWKLEMKEGGEFARQQQNRRTRFLSIVLCIAQSMGFISMLKSGLSGITPFTTVSIILFWTAGAMLVLWLGEQISERGIGNGVSLMIFAGIIISLPATFQTVGDQVANGGVGIFQILALLIVFLATTWLIVLFTVAQRRIPIQHMRRMQGTKQLGGQTTYLPLSVNMAGVIPIIFAISLIYLPVQFGSMFATNSPAQNALFKVDQFINPGSPHGNLFVGCILFSGLIFFFTYFYTAIQYNVDDIADNLKRGGSYIPGIRPGKQTSDFLNGVISRITIVGAAFLAVVALTQFLAPKLTGIPRMNIVGGTTLLIMVSVALETMRQIEANLLMKRYGS